MAAVGVGLALPLVGGAAAFASTAPAGSSSAVAATSTPSYRFSLSTHTLAFGSQNTGSVTAKTVTLKNTGVKALQPVHVLSGSAAVSLTGNTCDGFSVKPGAKCVFTVTFAPTVAGASAATLQVLTLQPTTAQKVSVTGTGVQQLMESYNYLYTFTNPPLNNGVAVPQSFLGTGFAAVGSYTPGQVITVTDATGLREIGTYRIGNVNNAVALDPAQLNHVAVSEYDWGTKRITAGTGLVSYDGTTGLGSERGGLSGYGAEGSTATFSDQYPAIHPIHF